MPDDVVTMDKIVALCKRRGFIFAASEIYGGIANTYDYGHYGVLLKNNVIDAWWKAMIQERDDIVALDSAIIQHPRTWEASGHLAGFTDPLVDCKTCKQRFRADHLGRARRAGASRPSIPGETPECDLTEAREFNLMFETTIGPVKEAGSTVYLRPETAQGIFLNFKNVLQFARRKPPFGIAQVGKSFRNEITPGNFIFRTLEFEQMEMEFFVPPDEAQQWHEHWLRGAHGLVHRARHPPRPPEAAPARRRRALALLVGHQRRRVPVSDRLVRARGHRQPRRLRPHPARAVLRREARVLRPADGRALRPARDRAGRRRRPRGARLPVRRLRRGRARRRARARCSSSTRALAPVKVAVLPLRAQGRPARASRARSTPRCARAACRAEYDEGGSIGKRYRRQDEIGTPYGVTVDHQTLEDRTVTVRDRDTLAQERIAIDELPDELARAPRAPWRSPKLG